MGRYANIRALETVQPWPRDAINLVSSLIIATFHYLASLARHYCIHCFAVLRCSTLTVMRLGWPVEIAIACHSYENSGAF